MTTDRLGSDGGDAVGGGDVVDGDCGEELVRHPSQRGQHEQAAVSPAEHALRPAVRGQATERGGDLIRHNRRYLPVARGTTERRPDHRALPRLGLSGGGGCCGVVVIDRRDPASLGGPGRRARGEEPQTVSGAAAAPGCRWRRTSR